jgi:beta-galactosidase
MYKRLFALLLCVLPALCGAINTVDLNADWKFLRADKDGAAAVTFDDAQWEAVKLPHTWNAFDGQDGGSNYYRGVGWYRRTLTLSDAYRGKTIYLRFGAANMTTTLFVNGEKVGTHTGGYAAFVFDVTKMLKWGAPNQIAVKVDNSEGIVAPPLSADFTFFGGLTRGVQLLVAEPIHIAPVATVNTSFLQKSIQVASPGVVIRQSAVSAKSASIAVTTNVRNASESSADVKVSVRVTDKAGRTVQTASYNTTAAAGATDTSSVRLTLRHPHLWNGLADPYLYSVDVALEVGGRTVDQSRQPLGLRFFKVDKEKGFFLNGRSYPLRGIDIHDEKMDKGRAVSDADRKADLDLIYDAGANFVRLAHYQHGDFTYRYLDSLGIVCWTEVPCVNEVGDTTHVAAYQQNASQQMYEMLYQQFNHPSIVFWGLCNEIMLRKSIADPIPVVRHLNQLVKSVDSYRLTTLACAGYTAEGRIPDVFSVNRYNGWYWGDASSFGPELDKHRAEYPAPMGVSEYGAGANVNQHEYPAQKHSAGGQFHPEEYQNLYHEAYLKAINERPYLWETSIWAGIDFACDARAEGSQPGINDKGLITHDRRTLKDSYFWYKVNWNQREGTVYITSRRFTERTSLSIPVKVYSNCPTVRLTVNGKVIGTKTSHGPYFPLGQRRRYGRDECHRGGRHVQGQDAARQRGVEMQRIGAE